MSRKDYLPSKEKDLAAWTKNFYAYVMTRYTSWGIPSPLSSLGSLKDEFDGALENVSRPDRTKIDITYKNDCKKKLVKALRTYIQAYIARNPAVGPEDRSAMGLPPRDEIRTPVKVPDAYVEFFFKVRGARQIDVHYKAQGSGSKARPYGCTGTQIRWLVSGEAASSVTELVVSDGATRTPFLLSLSDEERGKTVSVAMRWQNTKAQPGPWSEIQSTIVP